MIKKNILSQILSSHARSEVFRLLFDGQDRELYFREMERLSSISPTGLKKELGHLLEIDLLILKKDGNRVYYSANRRHPLYKEIVGLVEKTVGINSLICEAFKSIDEIEVAFIFGSVAENKEKGHSDIDLFVIGEITLRNLVKVLSKIQMAVGREINPHIYSKKELHERIKKKDHFVTSVMKVKKVFVKGVVDDVEGMS